MIARKVGPALASGCTLVIKPSELTPLIALAAAELALQLGIPPGVLNVVMGDPPSIGVSLLESTQVRKITFTGSTGVGKKLMAGASETVKKVSLELGRNAPCIIFDDADLELAVKVCQLNSITLDNNVYAQIEYLCKKAVPGATGSSATGATYFGVIETTKKWIRETHLNLGGHSAPLIAGALGRSCQKLTPLYGMLDCRLVEIEASRTTDHSFG
uniref:Putative aldehyde/histidinol dehydrogenase n=1 Tax=Helianthus annuus TaxID=4232 RepID=A0A251VKT8_HELAN